MASVVADMSWQAAGGMRIPSTPSTNPSGTPGSLMSPGSNAGSFGGSATGGSAGSAGSASGDSRSMGLSISIGRRRGSSMVVTSSAMATPAGLSATMPVGGSGGVEDVSMDRPLAQTMPPRHGLTPSRSVMPSDRVPPPLMPARSHSMSLPSRLGFSRGLRVGITGPTCKTSESGELAVLGIRVGAASMRGQRDANEDNYTMMLPANSCAKSSAPCGASPMGTPGMTPSPAAGAGKLIMPAAAAQWAWLGVFDGHGGVKASCLVTRLLHQHVMRHLAKAEAAQASATSAAAQEQAIKDAFIHGFIAQERDLFARLWERSRDGSGTTAVVALVSDTHLVVAHCGDSRAVLSADGTAVRLTQDHRPTNEGEALRLKQAGVVTQGDRIRGLSVSRCLGDFDLKRAGANPTPLGGSGTPRAAAVGAAAAAPFTPAATASTAPSTGAAGIGAGAGIMQTPRRSGNWDQALIATPDVLVQAWTPKCEFVILACDGVWDVISDEDAVRYVRDYLQGQAAQAAVAGMQPPVGMDLDFGGEEDDDFDMLGDDTPVKQATTAASSAAFGSLSKEVAVAAAEALIDHCYRLGSTDNLTALVLLR